MAKGRVKNGKNLRKGRKTTKKIGVTKTGLKQGKQLTGIKQGVGGVTRRAFGSAARTATTAVSAGALNAFHPSHLSLPRSVGPYTTVRVSQVIQSDAAFMIFGTTWFIDQWTNTCALSWNDQGQTLDFAGNFNRYVFQNLEADSWDGCTFVPSCFSLQIMNPGALQTTSGIVYGGRYRTVYDPESHSTERVDGQATQFIAFNFPRLMAAAKLAMRGVHLDLVPFNMSALADFTQRSEWSQATNNTYALNQEPLFRGFAPAAIYNPNRIPLQYLVCMEMRVRFDPSNPAQATHRRYPVASDNTWERVSATMERQGNGVRDIADVVANVGNFIEKGVGAFNAISPMIAAIA